MNNNIVNGIDDSGPICKKMKTGDLDIFSQENRSLKRTLSQSSTFLDERIGRQTEYDQMERELKSVKEQLVLLGDELRVMGNENESKKRQNEKLVIELEQKEKEIDELKSYYICMIDSEQATNEQLVDQNDILYEIIEILDAGRKETSNANQTVDNKIAILRKQSLDNQVVTPVIPKVNDPKIPVVVSKVINQIVTPVGPKANDPKTPVVVSKVVNQVVTPAIQKITLQNIPSVVSQVGVNVSQMQPIFTDKSTDSHLESSQSRIALRLRSSDNPKPKALSKLKTPKHNTPEDLPEKRD
uniref:CortBP2 domain-containing protein n=1 Tax=Rhabditophanes sp. KR3021 TaxID=114890 RepID=A0AC35TVT9_9BILA